MKTFEKLDRGNGLIAGRLPGGDEGKKT